MSTLRLDKLDLRYTGNLPYLFSTIAKQGGERMTTKKKGKRAEIETYMDFAGNTIRFIPPNRIEVTIRNDKRRRNNEEQEQNH